MTDRLEKVFKSGEDDFLKMLGEAVEHEDNRRPARWPFLSEGYCHGRLKLCFHFRSGLKDGFGDYVAIAECSEDNGAGRTDAEARKGIAFKLFADDRCAGGDSADRKQLTVRVFTTKTVEHPEGVPFPARAEVKWLHLSDASLGLDRSLSDLLGRAVASIVFRFAQKNRELDSGDPLGVVFGFRHDELEGEVVERRSHRGDGSADVRSEAGGDGMVRLGPPTLDARALVLLTDQRIWVRFEKLPDGVFDRVDLLLCEA